MSWSRRSNAVSYFTKGPGKAKELPEHGLIQWVDAVCEFGVNFLHMQATSFGIDTFAMFAIKSCSVSYRMTL